MSWIVTAKIRGKRIDSKIFKNKTQAIAFQEDTKRFRPGSNPRLKKLKK